MNLNTLANFATTLTVLVAILFGLLEVRRTRQEHAERAAFSVISAIMSPVWIDSLNIVLLMPASTSAEDIQNNPDWMRAIHSIGYTMEAIGYAVFCRLIPLSTVDDLIGGATLLAWRQTRAYAQAERDRSGSEKVWEWYQWLSEQLERDGTATSDMHVGAHVKYRNWRPARTIERPRVK
ncbi:MAG: hypothetical protein ABIZ18_06335 [Caldimonas sp.]